MFTKQLKNSIMILGIYFFKGGKIMKKFLSISIIMILIIGMLAGGVNAASASISASSKNVSKGDTVTVTVSFGDRAKTARFVLNYDTSKLEYLSYSCGGSGNKGFNAGTFAYYGAVSPDISSVSFTFKAKATGTANVSFSSLKISTATQNNITAGVGNSSTSITIKEKQQTNTTKPSTKPNTNKKPTTTKPEETKEPEVVEPTPNELIKLDNENAKTLKNDENNIMIKYMPNALGDGVTLEVKNIDNENERYQSIDEILKEITANKTYLEINLVKDNEKIQPNGYVTVCIKIPEEYNKEKVELYCINEENSSYELVQGEIQEDYYTFTTNNLSTYALIERIEETETEPEPIQEVSVMETVKGVFTNVILLYVIIGILLIIVIVQRIKISGLQK